MTPQERESMLNCMSDMSKDATGCRLRLDYAGMTDDQLQATFDGFQRDIVEGIAREKAQDAKAKSELEEAIANIINSGAGNRATALRWLVDEERDVDFALYKLGIGYDDRAAYSREIRA